LGAGEQAKEAGRPLHGPALERRTLAATCTAHFVHDGIADAYYVLLPIWAQAFGLSYVQVGTLRMAYSTAMACLQLPAGMLAARVGERTLLAAGSILAGVAFALLATSQSYLALAGLILLSGVGSAVQHPIASTLISRAYAPASRRTALGVYNFVGDIGKMTIAAAIGLGVVAIGWRNSAALYGAIVAAVGVLTLLALAHLAGAPRPRAASGAPREAGWGFTDPTGFALLSGIQLIDSACRTGLLTFLPFLLIAKGASVASIGFGLALVFIGGAAGKLVCGLIAERVGILRTVILTEVVTGALITAVVAVPLAPRHAAAGPARRGPQRHIVRALRHRRRVRARRPPEPQLRAVLHAGQRRRRHRAARVWRPERRRRRAGCIARRRRARHRHGADRARPRSARAQDAAGAGARLGPHTGSSGALRLAPGTMMPPRSPMVTLPKRSA
jgi:FSR family fosmidomycin resistance protein-like MFS transporter